MAVIVTVVYTVMHMLKFRAIFILWCQGMILVRLIDMSLIYSFDSTSNSEAVKRWSLLLSHLLIILKNTILFMNVILCHVCR